MATQWASLGEIEAAVAAEVGFILFTILSFSADGRRMTRIHTSHPREYPAGGTKDLQRDVSSGWVDACVRRQRPFLGPTKVELRQVFGDAAEIERLGCGSVLNAPVVSAGSTIAALNILGREHAYADDHVRAAERIAARSVTAVLDAARSLP